VASSLPTFPLMWWAILAVVVLAVAVLFDRSQYSLGGAGLGVAIWVAIAVYSVLMGYYVPPGRAIRVLGQLVLFWTLAAWWGGRGQEPLLAKRKER